jgi:hypothetical protein
MGAKVGFAMRFPLQIAVFRSQWIFGAMAFCDLAAAEAAL